MSYKVTGERVLYCSFCQSEADAIIKQTDTPICNSCLDVYQCGQASPESTFEELYYENTEVSEFMESNNFTEWQTGGNCTAYGRVNTDHTEVMITRYNDVTTPNTMCEAVTIGLYDEGNQLKSVDCNNLTEAVQYAWANQFIN